MPLEEGSQSSAVMASASELQILKAEVADSGATITRLQTQLKESEAEMEEMGLNGCWDEDFTKAPDHLSPEAGGTTVFCCIVVCIDLDLVKVLSHSQRSAEGSELR